MDLAATKRPEMRIRRARKYTRVNPKYKPYLADLYALGDSKESISNANGISIGNVCKFIHQANPPDNRIFRSHDLVVRLRTEYGVELNEYASILGSSTVLHTLGVSEESNASIREVILACYMKGINLKSFVAAFDNFSKFIHSVRYGFIGLKTELYWNLCLWSNLEMQVTAKRQEVEALRNRIEIMKQIENKKKQIHQ